MIDPAPAKKDTPVRFVWWFTPQSYANNTVSVLAKVEVVLSGDFDAGAVKPAVFRKFEAKGLRTIVKVPKISEHLFVTRDNCSTELIEKLRFAMLSISNSEEGMTALRAIKGSITGLVKAGDSDYEKLRKIIIETQGFH